MQLIVGDPSFIKETQQAAEDILHRLPDQARKLQELVGTLSGEGIPEWKALMLREGD